ncbi:malectin domain-containing carbohydrate-binding protein [Streptomyces sp. ISL-66]|uniref:malectin domain-containing carbohydrate-binding protein n=1 Tax=Streptomyces sp. ISL-66 TaxID=2819186 RepID=UPI0020364E57|nr:malectin domain-containing carbohydrate-binding protein [Streptomyces sp. ISL-66]
MTIPAHRAGSPRRDRAPPPRRGPRRGRPGPRPHPRARSGRAEDRTESARPARRFREGRLLGLPRQRRRPHGRAYEYRFDNVPNGTYTVELGFAELSSTKPNKRVFDVLAEGTQVLPSLDISLEAGAYTALTRTYTVTVTDGALNVRFVTHSGYGKPLLNTLRVTDRPDKS